MAVAHHPSTRDTAHSGPDGPKEIMDSTSPSTEPVARRAADSRWWLAAGTAAILVALLIVTTASAADPHIPRGTLPRTASEPAPSRVRASGPTTTTTTTTAPPAPTPPPPPGLFTAEETLLTPEDVPDPSVRRPIQVIGSIHIPKIGLDTDLRDQITQESIDLGPSHWPGTAAPGGFGNAVIAGHRSSHSAPFHDLGELTTGDSIILIDGLGRPFTYKVTDMFVVNPDAMWITEQSPGRTLTIFTCHPIGSSAQRLVVRATLA
jgi:sortase A